MGQGELVWDKENWDRESSVIAANIFLLCKIYLKLLQQSYRCV